MNTHHEQPHEHPHEHKKTKAVLNRLARIEGHIRSVRTMVSEGRDCSDVLLQISAVRSAIDKVGKVVLEDHLESCLIRTGHHQDENEIWNGVKEALDVYF